MLARRRLCHLCLACGWNPLCRRRRLSRRLHQSTTGNGRRIAEGARALAPGGDGCDVRDGLGRDLVDDEVRQAEIGAVQQGRAYRRSRKMRRKLASWSVTGRVSVTPSTDHAFAARSLKTQRPRVSFIGGSGRFQLAQLILQCV